MKIFLLPLLLLVSNFITTICLGNYSNIFVNSTSEDAVAIFNTSASGGYLGFSVNSAGDFNGDGYEDILISSLGVPGKTGVAYVIYGGKNPLENIDLTSGIDSSQGFTVTGASTGDYFGISANKAGDVNGDGVDDIVIGAYYVNSRAGAVYVVYGKKGSHSNIDLSSGMTSSQGFTIAGLSSYAYLGISATWAGDINGDKLDDIIIGAFGVNSNTGVVYVIYGSKTRNSNIDLSSGLDSTQGFTITGASTDNHFGYSANYVGDVNADGMDDIIMGAYGVNGYTGVVYVVYGKKASQLPNIDLSIGLAETQGFAIIGANPTDYLGVFTAGGEDMNGDGIDDIILGAYLAKNKAGVVYVIFGKKGGLSNIALSSGLAPTQGYAIEGSFAFQRLGFSARFAGDINRDGVPDLVVGSLPINQTGAAYVIFGNKTVAGNLSLSQGLLATQGYTVYGTAVNDTFGRFVNGIGDMNHDGIDDIIIGSPNSNSYSGAAYVVYSPCKWLNGIYVE